MSNTDEIGAIDNVDTDLIPDQSNTLPEAPDTTAAPAEKPSRSSIIADALKDFDEDEPKKTEPDKPDVKAPLLQGKEQELKPGQEVDPLTGRVLEPINPPGSMSPALREKWGTVPREFQKMWVDREKHINETLKQSADARTFAKQFKEITAPYEPLLKHYKISAVDHAKELFHLSHALVAGTPQQRAQLYGDLFREFPPDFDVLVKMSQGQAVNVPRVQAPQAPFDLDAEVARRAAEMESEKHQQASQADIDAFASDPANRFFHDVQASMGRIIQEWVNVDPSIEERPLPELLKEAYDLACQQHPQIRAILAASSAPARDQNAPAAHSQQAPAPAAPAAPAQRPISSVKPSLSGGAKSKVPEQKRSREEIINSILEADGFQ